MVTTIYLVRHGETEGSGDGRYKGQIDVKLSAAGQQQIGRTAEALARIAAAERCPPAAVYSSDLSRAIVSGEIIAGRLGLVPQAVPALRERNFGKWEGMTFSEITERYPAEFAAWRQDPLRFKPVAGESTLEVRDRIMPALAALIEAHRGGSLAVVAHGGVNRIMLAEFLGLSLANIFRIEQSFACWNIIDLVDDFPLVRVLNSRPEWLPGDGG